MNIRGAIFDLDGTLTDSMYIWQKAPVDLMRRYGGDPPEDLARDLKEMGRRELAYRTFSTVEPSPAIVTSFDAFES